MPRHRMAAAVLAVLALSAGCGSADSPSSAPAGPQAPVSAPGGAPGSSASSPSTTSAAPAPAAAAQPANVELCPDGGQITCTGQRDIQVTQCAFDESHGSGSITYTVTNSTSAPVAYETSVTFNYTVNALLYISNARQSGSLAPGQSATRTEPDVDNAEHGVSKLICDVFFTETPPTEDA